MYALPNKTQHKLIVKVRGGISQKLENFSSLSATAAGFTSNNSSSSSNKDLSASGSTFGRKYSYPSSSTSKFSPSTESNFTSHSSSSLHDSHEVLDFDSLPQPVFHSIEHRGNRNNKSGLYRAQKQYITPEHNEMIKYVQQSWKGVERDYKKSVNNFVNTIDLKQTTNVKNKTATSSTPLLMPGSYHHSSNTKDSFQPFDLEAFWGNRILKSLTEDM